MVIDTSAVVASLTAEADADSYRAALKEADECAMSALNVFECRIVLDARYGDAVLQGFELLLAKLPIRVSRSTPIKRSLHTAPTAGSGRAAGIALG